MPNSLKCKLSSLRYKRLLTDEEYQELLKKLDGHDKSVRAKVIDKFVEKCKQNTNDMFGQRYVDVRVMDTIAEVLKGEKP